MRISLLLLLMLELSSCHNGGAREETAYPKGTFGYDVAFLRRYDSVVLLENGEAQVVVSPKYQAKVFTSTALGPDGPSYGWIHYPVFDAPPNTHMNAYGGENRLWLGPEGGPYSLFFAPGDSMVFAHWKTPAPFDNEPWTVMGQTATTVDLHKTMHLVNYQGKSLSLKVDRNIRLLNRGGIDSLLGIELGPGVKAVGYETTNTLLNDSDQPVCLWMLDMFPTSEHTVIIIPYKTGQGSPATTNYFGEIPADRIQYLDSVLLLKADGRSRGKLGIHPTRACNRAGSYDPALRLLTVIQYDVVPGEPYLNQEWTTQKPPFSGDAVNAYNDGPLADGSQMGPFYELESVSPVVKGQGTHRHLVCHFTGDDAALDSLSVHLLGISLKKVHFP
ncbi:DUF6786 family protein [Dinghuibacter silviterrae]|uniref:Methane monooxygenase PmoA-like n=1 Tax=Dinghuibacter silviterrae TaxID=1539049 RepID=A0A4R8DVD1_9BACT|nr:DUF6786 family protein [Dinghuibacter silviterrae]TDX02382.1 hypothetical protein EDB95_3440 [Dinghuibacter silviterrae]